MKKEYKIYKSKKQINNYLKNKKSHYIEIIPLTKGYLLYREIIEQTI